MKTLITTALLLTSLSTFAQNSGTGPGNGADIDSLNIQKTEKGTYQAIVSASVDSTSSFYLPLGSELLLQRRAEKNAEKIVKTSAHEFCADVKGTDNTKVKIKSLQSRISNLRSKSDNGLLLQCGTYGDSSMSCSGRILVEFTCD